MLLAILVVVLGLCAGGDAAFAKVAGQRFLKGTDGSDGAAALSAADLVIVYTTTINRLPLVHATRPARRGIRTYIVLQNASEAERLNELYGGPQGQHNETYLAWVESTARGSSGTNAGPYGRTPPQATHSLHTLGPAWAMAPLLTHAAAQSASSTPPAATTTSTSTAAAAPPPPPPPYRWMLLARDDTLWRPLQAVRLLSQYDDRVAAAVSDHLVDFNGRRLLAPSAAAAVCLPCGTNLTALLGRRHPPGVPQPGCPVCRPAGGCEFRFDLCAGLAGGPYCGSKRFLGSGDRCSHSWAAGGAGMALSWTLLSYLDQEDWANCVRGQRPSTGERSLGRCLWRSGFSFTHPAAGLTAGLSRSVFSERHMLFGNPLLREGVFGVGAESLLGPAYLAEAEEAAAKTAAAAAATTSGTAAAAKSITLSAAGFASGGAEAAAAMALPASTRERPAEASGECDAECRRWLDDAGVSVHLDVPYTADGGAAVDVAAAAALMERAAEGVALAAAE